IPLGGVAYLSLRFGPHARALRAQAAANGSTATKRHLRWPRSGTSSNAGNLGGGPAKSSTGGPAN
ncbi:MAG TPA: hypothetical protein VGG23_10955, partial [Acidimicrobiales bacterium]